ncbi:MAG: DUF3570 domain-containing protein [Gammaproteobacteria bacterium]
MNARNVFLILMTILMSSVSVYAATLPEDRTDLLYHAYEGDNADISGPAIVVRKAFGDKVSLSGKYYVDSVSSASIDVVTTASPYEEERIETSVGASYLYDSTQFSLNVTNSDENDFQARSYFFSVSQEMFGALTTVSLGFGRGDDTVSRNGDDIFEDEVNRQHYQLGLTQVLTKNWIASLDYEAITDEGFLNNPYRSVRYQDSSARGYAYEAEVYPRTRTSNSLSLRSRYFLKHGAALTFDYRYFTDTWDIEGHTVGVGYVHKFRDNWTFEVGYRNHSQSQAEFYSDLFERPQAQNFIARDKELSSFSDHMGRVGVSYGFSGKALPFVDRGSINFFFNRFRFDYDNFRDLTVEAPVGEEPLFGFDANVFQLYLSVWY